VLLEALLQACIADAPCLVAGLLIAWVLLRRQPGGIDRLLAHLRALAERPVLICSLVVLFPIALRLVLLPWSPIPHPVVHDEFSHLLVADTLASGRMANPTHPFWEHFETIYILHHPTYSSIYPLGQGAMLAFGQVVFGHPWFGVLVGIAVFNLALFWMLRALLPPGWTALGCLVAVLQFEIFGYWINSYWGGALAAAAGSFFFGALARFLKFPRYLWGLIAALAVFGLWHTRPFETVWMTFGGTALVIWRLRVRGFHQLFTSLLAFLVPLCCCLGFALSVTIWHNYRVTGQALTLPYQVSRKQYGVPVGLIWEKENEAPSTRFKNIEDSYRWQKRQFDRAASPRNLPGEWSHRLAQLWLVYVSLSLTIPCVVALLVRPKVGFPVTGFLLLALIASALYPFLFPHYLAGYTCLILILLVSGLRRLWEGGRIKRVLALGSILALVITAAAQLSFLFRRGAEMRRPHDTTWTVAEQLQKTPGKHLVFVRYSPAHDFNKEWVYNRANIDESRVVWAREISPAKDQALLKYFRDRKVWVLEPDTSPVVPRPYFSRTRQTGS